MMVKSKNNVLCNASELTHICGIGAYGNVSFVGEWMCYKMTQYHKPPFHQFTC